VDFCCLFLEPASGTFCQPGKEETWISYVVHALRTGFRHCHVPIGHVLTEAFQAQNEQQCSYATRCLKWIVLTIPGVNTSESEPRSTDVGTEQSIGRAVFQMMHNRSATTNPDILSLQEEIADRNTEVLGAVAAAASSSTSSSSISSSTIFRVQKEKRKRAVIPILNADKKKDSETDVKKDQCVMCMENEKWMMCYPCGHICACRSCVDRLITISETKDASPGCPVCRKDCQQFMGVFEASLE
jgi:hypothetical protein